VSKPLIKITAFNSEELPITHRPIYKTLLTGVGMGCLHLALFSAKDQKRFLHLQEMGPKTRKSMRTIHSNILRVNA
jgi:hypothetical protein